MDASSWLASQEPEKLLEWLSANGRLTERKARLFAVACCRRLWPLLADARSRNAVEVAERFADGAAGIGELIDAGAAACEVLDETEAPVVVAADLYPHAYAAVVSACYYSSPQGPFTLGDAAAAARWARSGSPRQAECLVHCQLLRDIFGNPFGPPPASPPTWGDGLIRRLVRAAYEQRVLPTGTLDPARLAVLADALEESGCTDTGLLGHLRSPGPHVRGCFALDLILGRN